MPESTWAVIDVETTGLSPVRDRVVEIAVIRLDENANVTDEWATLVSPGSRELLTRIHGIRAADLENAPTYAEILPELHAVLSGQVLVAHNAPFDVAFLQAESNRAGIAWGPVEGLCTLALTKDLGLAKSRKLELACQELGITIGAKHSAVADARAVAEIMGRLASRLWTLPAPGGAPEWPTPSEPARLKPREVKRSDSPASSDPSNPLSSMAIPHGLGVADSAASTYLGLLDHVVDDGVVTDSEVEALAMFANACGISRGVARQLHAAYLEEMWRLARADQVVIREESTYLADLAVLLTKALPR